MLQIGDAVVSLDVLREYFVCDLEACRGICCIEGDSGAPVLDDEVERLDEVLPVVWDDLSDEAREVIRRQGTTYVDADGDGFVDNVTLVFAGASDVSSRYKLWPHRSDLIASADKAVTIHGKKMVSFIMVFDRSNGFDIMRDLPITPSKVLAAE